MPQQLVLEAEVSRENCLLDTDRLTVSLQTVQKDLTYDRLKCEPVPSHRASSNAWTDANTATAQTTRDTVGTVLILGQAMLA
jgi:hypothetical protein